MEWLPRIMLVYISVCLEELENALQKFLDEFLNILYALDARHT